MNGDVFLNCLDNLNKHPDIFLVVPFAEKDEAKALGARWDPKHRAWFVRWPTDATKFSKWLPMNEVGHTGSNATVESDLLPWE